MNSLTSYLKHVREEFRHIAWPSTRTAIAHTLVVILIAIAITVFVAVLDKVFEQLVSQIVNG